MNELETMFEFKTMDKIFWKERDGVKNNTVRQIDWEEDRHTQLIAWSEIGWNDGDIQIKIVNADTGESFVRDICDVTLWCDLMIITWHPKKS